MDLPTLNEDLLTKHRRERKELQAKIQSLKKSCNKGDKKKKREVTEQIARLEADLNERQEQELKEETPNTTNEAENQDFLINSKEDTNENTPLIEINRISRAQKRRNKKQAEEKDRELRIQEQEEQNKHGPRVLEQQAIKLALEDVGLQIYNIPADGNCMYCAIHHQLKVTGRDIISASELRKLTAEFIKQHKQDFLPFMCTESDEPMNETEFEAYCKKVASTTMWGGQLELRALSQALQCPIKIIQATGPPTMQGETYSGPPLILTYHRHLYRLGEHYNSTINAAS